MQPKSTCVCAVPDTEKSASGQRLIWDTFAILSCYSTHWNTVGLLIPSEPQVVAPKGWSLLQHLSCLMRLQQSSQNCGIVPYSVYGQIFFFFLWHALNIPSITNGLAWDFQWNFYVLDTQLLPNFSRPGPLSTTKIFWHLQSRRTHFANNISSTA